MFIAPDPNRKIWGPAGYGKSKKFPWQFTFRENTRKMKIKKIFNVGKEDK